MELTQKYLLDNFTYADGKLYHKKNNREVKDSFHLFGKLTKVPRIIYMMNYGILPGHRRVFHLDGNSKNNLLSNLHSPSSMNSCHTGTLSVTNTSGVRGVSWAQQKNKWRAIVCHNYNKFHIGYFDSIINAEISIKAFRRDVLPAWIHANEDRVK